MLEAIGIVTAFSAITLYAYFIISATLVRGNQVDGDDD